jgi:hypothetical protein
MHGQGAHGAFTIETVSDPQPGIPAVTTPPDALSKRSYTDGGLFRHGFSPYSIRINDPYACLVCTMNLAPVIRGMMWSVSTSIIRLPGSGWAGGCHPWTFVEVEARILAVYPDATFRLGEGETP